MFDYPLPLPGDSEYARLHVGPEATPQELGEAKGELKSALNARIMALTKQVERITDRVPGLRQAYENVAALEREGDEANPAELSEAHKRMLALERDAQQIEPKYSQWRKERGDLEAQVNALNRLNLQNQETRTEYDRSNPPFEILKLEDATRDEHLRNPRTALHLLRRELTAFFEEQGEEVFHPTDLTRWSFAADFVHNPYLDGEAS